MWKSRLHVYHCFDNYWRLSNNLVYAIDQDKIVQLQEMKNMWRYAGVEINSVESEFEIVIPAGFYTDMGSIHQSLWWFIAPWDIGRPAILHDYLYSKLRPLWKQEHPCRHTMKKQADKLFKQAMRDDMEIDRTRQYMAYGFVRLFGRLSLSRKITTNEKLKDLYPDQ